MDSSCNHCSTPHAANARFCQQCGSPLVSGAQAVSVPAWKSKYVDNYFRGQVKSTGKGELWTYENGLLKGPNTSFAWLGDVLRPTGDGQTGDWSFGHGNYDGTLVSWSFPEMKNTFYEYSIGADEKILTCEKIAFGGTKFNWRLEGIRLTTAEKPALEGTEDSWEVTGDVPLPVALFAVCFGKAQLLHKKLTERLNRKYARCGKLVLAAGKTPRVCAACAGAACMVCGNGEIESFHSGNLCKSCAPKAGLCGRCSDPLRGSQEEGRLCGACGLGSRAMNCARMLHGKNI